MKRSKSMKVISGGLDTTKPAAPIKTFKHAEYGQVRMILIDGKPWFAGKDVGCVLGYTNPRKAVKDHVRIENRTSNESFTVNGVPMTLIDDAGINQLLYTRRKYVPKDVENWLLHEVITPSKVVQTVSIPEENESKNGLTAFENEEFGTIRTVMIDGEPWFVGKDVAGALGYKDSVNALKDHVDEEDKGGWQIATQFGEKMTVIVNESGLYSLILSSKLPTAKKFKRWVTSEILPSIRKTGSYRKPEAQEILDYWKTPLGFQQLLEMHQGTLIELAELKEKVEEDRPKIEFADAVYDAKELISIGDLAKLVHSNGVNIGRNSLYAYLRKEGFLCQCRGDDYNMPTQRAMKMKLFHVKEYVVNFVSGYKVSKTVKVTGKGQRCFVKYLLDRIDQVNAFVAKQPVELIV